MRQAETNRDFIADVLWHERRGIVVTPSLLAEALEIIESEYGVGRSLNQRDIADAVVALIHARQRATSQSSAERRVPLEIRDRTDATPARTGAERA
jgi:hypothetical protein